MKTELQNKLFEKYPKIFRQKDLPMEDTCMCWGIECGDGWYDLINNLCFTLQFNTDNNNNYPQVEAVQVKEKFGSLRFYYWISNEGSERHYGNIEGRICFAESLSTTICEHCGTNQNVTQTEGWISTVCEDCLKRMKS